MVSIIIREYVYVIRCYLDHKSSGMVKQPSYWYLSYENDYTRIVSIVLQYYSKSSSGLLITALTRSKFGNIRVKMFLIQHSDIPLRTLIFSPPANIHRQHPWIQIQPSERENKLTIPFIKWNITQTRCYTFTAVDLIDVILSHTINLKIPLFHALGISCGTYILS